MNTKYRVFVDGSNHTVRATLKNTIGESIHDNDKTYDSDTIVLVSFGLQHRLSGLQILFSTHMVAI
jgi:hypothetical protein